MELLPEEALYLLERGSMQIWCSPSAYERGLCSGGGGGVSGSSLNKDKVEKEEEEEVEQLVWDEQGHGFRGMVEMTAMEGFARFIGQDGLSLERYQVRFSPPARPYLFLPHLRHLFLRVRVRVRW